MENRWPSGNTTSSITRSVAVSPETGGAGVFREVFLV